MMMHPDELTLARWLDGERLDALRDLADHLAVCDACQERLSAVAGEATTLRAALAFTADELATLYRADLPGRVAATVAAGARHSAAGQGALHLLGLFGVGLAVALTWALLYPAIEPVLIWIERLAGLTTLAWSAGVALGIAMTNVILTSPLLPIGLLASELLALAAGVLLVGLWLHRLRPAPSTSLAG